MNTYITFVGKIMLLPFLHLLIYTIFSVYGFLGFFPNKSNSLYTSKYFVFSVEKQEYYSESFQLFWKNMYVETRMFYGNLWNANNIRYLSAAELNSWILCVFLFPVFQQRLTIFHLQINTRDSVTSTVIE